MKFKITTPLPQPTDSFVVEITTYQGDSDGNSVFRVGPFVKGKDEESLQSLIETLERVLETFRWPTNQLENHHYDVLGFYHWFSNEDRSIEFMQENYPEILERHGVEVHTELARLTDGFYPDWPMDHLYGLRETRYGFICESLRQYKVFYYDNAGVKYSVVVEE